MPEEADVFITVGSRKMQELAEKQFADLPCRSCKVLLIPNRGRDVGSVLVAVNPEILEYDYVCFAHDKKVTQLEVESVGASWAYECFESVLKTKITSAISSIPLKKIRDWDFDPGPEPRGLFSDHGE